MCDPAAAKLEQTWTLRVGQGNERTGNGFFFLANFALFVPKRTT